MVFTSYAQNFEDVILWRALGHVKDGFYVDCGAYHPQEDSVTKAFYDRGWHGINVEPVTSLLHNFKSTRITDINLNVALSNTVSSAVFYEILNTGLSTFSSDIARQHIDQGFFARKMEVQTETLSNVLASHAPNEIHFLKIDVEGAEQIVIDGLDLSVYRPWIILIEATRPRSRQLAHADWDNALLANGYEFVYFDGLNRFYLAREHQDLRDKIAIPPNPFDHYVQAAHLQALQQLKNEIHVLKSSSSWRLTAPLRFIKTSGQKIAFNLAQRLYALFDQPLRMVSGRRGTARRTSPDYRNRNWGVRYHTRRAARF